MRHHHFLFSTLKVIVTCVLFAQCSSPSLLILHTYLIISQPPPCTFPQGDSQQIIHTFHFTSQRPASGDLTFSSHCAGCLLDPLCDVILGFFFAFTLGIPFIFFLHHILSFLYVMPFSFLLYK